MTETCPPRPRGPRVPGSGRYGCNCTYHTETRNKARERRARIREEERAAGQLTNTKLVDARPSVEHLKRLRQEHGVWAAMANVVSATGLEEMTLHRLDQRDKVEYITEKVILSTDLAALRRAATMCPFVVAEQRVRSMQAQGWSLRWQAEQLGYSGSAPPPFISRKLANLAPREQRYVFRDVFDKVEALYARVGDKKGPSERSRRNAAQGGWLPGIYYDDNGNLIPEAIRDERMEERKAAREMAAQAHLDAIRLSLAGISAIEIVERVPGMNHERQVQRVRSGVGLSFDQVYDDDGARRLVLKEETRQRVREVRAILAAHDARLHTEDPDEDTSAWRTVHYDLNLMHMKRWTWDVPKPEQEEQEEQERHAEEPVDLADMDQAA